MPISDWLRQRTEEWIALAEAVERLGSTPTITGGGQSASDQARADYRRRLQDPLEIEALKRRLGLR